MRFEPRLSRSSGCRVAGDAHQVVEVEVFDFYYYADGGEEDGEVFLPALAGGEQEAVYRGVVEHLRFLRRSFGFLDPANKFDGSESVASEMTNSYISFLNSAGKSKKDILDGGVAVIVLSAELGRGTH